jgi:hypothetical protein
MDVPLADGGPQGADRSAALHRLVGYTGARGGRRRRHELEGAASGSRPPAPAQAASAAPRPARRASAAHSEPRSRASRQDAQEGESPLIDDGIAVHYSELARGTPVFDSGELQVGTVDEVRDLPREHMLDGIVIKTTEGERRFVDAPEVARTAERAVTLTITAAEVAELPLEPARVVPPGLTRLFRRRR